MVLKQRNVHSAKQAVARFAVEIQVVSIRAIKKSLFVWKWHDRGRFMNTPGLVVLASSLNINSAAGSC